MKQHEIKALRKLGVPLKKWGEGYRIKVRAKSGRFTYITNINKSHYAEQITKLYPKAFKGYNTIEERVKKFKTTLKDEKPRFRAWDGNKKKQRYLFEKYSQDEVFKKIEDVLSGQKKAFKLALLLGYRLIDRTTGEERYFAPGSNSYVFSELIQINDKADIQSRVMDTLNSSDFKEKINFPASAYQLDEITAFHLAIHPLNHRLGDEKIVIPQAITNNRNIINYPKTENKCVFYCVAGFLNADKDYRRLQGPVKELFKQYCSFKETEYTLPYFKSFEGVDMMDFHELEDCYQLNINVFEMDIDNEAISMMRETKKSYERTMNILDYKEHAMLIKNIAKFEGRHICDRCEQIYTTQKKLSDHKRTMCDKKVLESFVSGPTVYEPPQNKIETMLRKYGIKDIDHYLSHFIVYDFEALMTVIEAAKDEEDKKTKKTNIHKPMSVSIFSSICVAPKCFVSEDSRQLLTDMFDYIYSIQEKVYTYNAKKYAKLFYAIGDYTKDKDMLNDILNQVPVLGFNSGRYDINLIKKDLFSAIGTKNINMVIKNPSYMCIATDRFKMLDICNYIAAGTSYEKYLKAFGVVCQCEDKIKCVCSNGKGSFCYEYVTDFSKLNETELPPQEASYSNLKKKHLSDEEYERLKFVWSHYKMKTLKDLLIWYNNLDVVPFVEAVKRQREFYKSYKLDMLADGVSLPSLAEKIMYQISFREMKPIEFKQGKPFKFSLERFRGYKQQDNDSGRDNDLDMWYVNKRLSQQNYSCSHCGIALTQETASVDRLNNSRGHTNDNFMISCVSCNVARKNMSIHAFRRKKQLEANADRLVFSIDDENKDIYHKMKANIAGGPSIIFTRYAERNITTIRGGKTCKKVIGYDANALYLWALGNHMPCGRLTTIEPYEGLIDDIKNDKIFGFLECDIETPEHLKDYFSEMTPIFNPSNTASF